MYVNNKNGSEEKASYLKRSFIAFPVPLNWRIWARERCQVVRKMGNIDSIFGIQGTCRRAPEKKIPQQQLNPLDVRLGVCTNWEEL